MLLAANQALDMLAAHAPRAWAKRVLSWQIYIGDFNLYFASGTITESLYGFALLHEAAKAGSGPGVDGVRTEFGEETATALVKLGNTSLIPVRTDTWSNEARAFPGAVLVYAEELDWEAGCVLAKFHRENIGELRWFEELEPQYRDSELTMDLASMCFELEKIEMMAPSAEAPKGDLFSLATQKSEPPVRKPGPGRRREYDWDGALLYLVGQAEKNSIAPDPEAHGAQANIARVLADWFSLNGGKVPADSQLQACAKRALDAIRGTRP
jgi:hypothetical protein